MASTEANQRPLDLISVGRVQVDLYGEQIGGCLEDMRSFVKLLGGAPANIAVGASRLGLRVGMISRVGDEQMGRFALRALEREKVDTRGIVRDAERLTSLALLGIRDSSTFPLLYYRRDCADAALSPTDIEAAYIASARAIVVTGTLCAALPTRAACHEIIRIAREAGTDVVLDIDFRPVLWGLTSMDMGESRFISSRSVTDEIRLLLPSCDLVVGTEEEFQIAGGADDIVAALEAVRKVSSATLVVKLGAAGCVVFEHEIPENRRDWDVVEGFPVDVVNVLGAGDAFLAGLLRGRLRGADWHRACVYANACGAIVVTRNSCAPATPTLAELELFLQAGRASTVALAQDPAFARLHRHARPSSTSVTVAALALPGYPKDRGQDMRANALKAVASLPQPFRLASLADIPTDLSGDLIGLLPHGIWQGVRYAGSRLDGMAGRAYDTVNALPTNSHPIAAPSSFTSGVAAVLTELANACAAQGKDLFVELPLNSAAELVAAVHGAGVKPDWWLVPSGYDDATLVELAGRIHAGDAQCCGLIVTLAAGESTTAAPNPQMSPGSLALRAIPLLRIGRQDSDEPVAGQPG